MRGRSTSSRPKEEHKSEGDPSSGPPELRAVKALEQLIQSVRPSLEQIVASAELVENQSANAEAAESARQIMKAAGDLIDSIDRATGPDQTPTVAQPEGTASCDIIYVEDDPVNFTLVKRILAKRPSLTLAHAPRGEAGVSLARTHKPKLILLDLNLPDMHGSEVLRQLQEHEETARIPVVVISADATASQIERLLSAGARNYLTKPFTIHAFLAVVDEVLEESMRAG